MRRFQKMGWLFFLSPSLLHLILLSPLYLFILPFSFSHLRPFFSSFHHHFIHLLLISLCNLDPLLPFYESGLMFTHFHYSLSFFYLILHFLCSLPHCPLLFTPESLLSLSSHFFLRPHFCIRLPSFSSPSLHRLCPSPLPTPSLPSLSSIYLPFYILPFTFTHLLPVTIFSSPSPAPLTSMTHWEASLRPTITAER